MKQKAWIFSVIVLFLIGFSSCNKNINPVNLATQATNTSLDEEFIDELNDDLIEELLEIDGIIFGGFKDGRLDCRTITVEPLDRNVWPKTITIDFGSGCEVRDSIVKKGKIIIKQSAPRNTDSWEKVVTFDGYAVNNTQIEGTHTISFSLESGNPVWTSVITGSKITKEDGTVITREATYVREQIAGTETPRNRFDNIYLLTGDASGVNCNGDSYTSVITKPLVINMGCRWIQEGTKEIHIGDKPLITLDFGDGTCDNKATLTQNGETREIILRGMRRR